MTKRQPRSKFPAKVDLLERLVDPRLEGARCAGKAPWFDAELPEEEPEHRSSRLSWAANQCRQCPVQAACRVAAVEQDHPRGVWAAVAYGIEGRPKVGAA
ncbi:WhiB family transcriptional regulator [Rhodococcus sp. NPDC060090]|uniref:WhiB family transcriptional regulator n=1 Tax=Rhodococcus sp. NPDC060090 TaxID=3347056 RepID=UPI00366734CA